jgi:hypothetical protein
MVAYFHEGNIDFGHKVRAVGLDHVEKGIEHIFLYEGSEEVVVQVGILLTVGNLR